MYYLVNFTASQVFQLQVTFIKICDESPEPIVVPKIQYYPNIDNNETGNPPQDVGKGKARATNDNNLLVSKILVK